MTRSALVRRMLFLAAAGAGIACSGSDVPKVPLAQAAGVDNGRAVEAAHSIIGPAARAALDSGNTLFRRKAYAEALVHYRSASTLAPNHPAPFFGIYMVARATNDTAMADSALTAIRLRNGPMAPVPHSMKDSAVRRMHQLLQKKASS